MNESMRSVTIARQIDRPSAKQFIDEMFDDFLEFHGDRLFGDDGAIIGGIASLNGMPVTVIGIQKGHTLEENVNCNFGQPNPEGYRKALRIQNGRRAFSPGSRKQRGKRRKYGIGNLVKGSRSLSRPCAQR